MTGFAPSHTRPRIARLCTIDGCTNRATSTVERVDNRCTLAVCRKCAQELVAVWPHQYRFVYTQARP